MTGRASPIYGRLATAVQALAESGFGAAAIREALVPEYGREAVWKALSRAYAANVLPRPAKKRLGLLTIQFSSAAARRIQQRAEREGMRPHELAKIILHRASRVVDTMELHR